jgi:3'(2'), 5'-bisphosphate nucleotidase
MDNHMIDLHSPDIKFALETVRQVAVLVKQVQAEMVTQAITKEVLTKGDKSPVTVADFTAQALTAYHLMGAFPNDPLVGEEDAGVLESPHEAAPLERVTYFVSKVLPQATPGKVTTWIDYGNAEPADRFWTVDPIDGTKGFLRGGQYAVALALIEKGEVQIGVLGCPNLTDGTLQEMGGPGSLVIAQRGHGAWTTPLVGELDFIQLHVSDTRENTAARFLRSFEAGHTNVGQLDRIAQEMGVAVEPVLLDSQAKYAILAGGAGDLIFRLISPKMPDYKEKIWDQAAGSLVAQEAGGKVTDLDGKPLDFTQGRRLVKNRGLLVSNTYLHEAALDAIKKVGA